MTWTFKKIFLKICISFACTGSSLWHVGSSSLTGDPTWVPYSGGSESYTLDPREVPTWVFFFARMTPHTGLLENNRWLLIWGLCHISTGADGGYAFLAATCMGMPYLQRAPHQGTWSNTPYWWWGCWPPGSVCSVPSRHNRCFFILPAADRKSGRRHLEMMQICYFSWTLLVDWPQESPSRRLSPPGFTCQAFLLSALPQESHKGCELRRMPSLKKKENNVCPFEG